MAEASKLRDGRHHGVHLIRAMTAMGGISPVPADKPGGWLSACQATFAGGEAPIAHLAGLTRRLVLLNLLS